MPQRAFICGADHSQLNFAAFWKRSRPEITKSEIGCKIACFKKILNIINATLEVEVDGVQESTFYSETRY